MLPAHLFTLNAALATQAGAGARAITKTTTIKG
jgi:hypothetical protein